MEIPIADIFLLRIGQAESAYGFPCAGDLKQFFSRLCETSTDVGGLHENHGMKAVRTGGGRNRRGDPENGAAGLPSSKRQSRR